MAVSLKVRSGSPLRVVLNYWEPGREHEKLVETSGYTARLQLRATQHPGRVILNAREYVPENSTDTSPSPPGTVLRRIEPGSWQLTLSSSLTKALPSSTRFELELQSNSDPEDSIPLVNGVLVVEPQVITNA